MSALLVITALSGAVADTSIVNPQVPGTPIATFPRFHVIVFAANTPKGTVVQEMVAVSRFASKTSVIVTPVAVMLPSFM